MSPCKKKKKQDTIYSAQSKHSHSERKKLEHGKEGGKPRKTESQQCKH
jgi:hypothetical protein